MNKTSIKIFILEDNPDRIKWFEEHLADNIVARTNPPTDYDKKNVHLFFAESVKEAEEVWKKYGPFDAYFLDHDLGGQVMVDSSEPNTGYAFSMFLVDNGVNGQAEDIFIHSLNPVGADNMYNLFANAKKVRMFNF